MGHRRGRVHHHCYPRHGLDQGRQYNGAADRRSGPSAGSAIAVVNCATDGVQPTADLRRELSPPVDLGPQEGLGPPLEAGRDMPTCLA